MATETKKMEQRLRVAEMYIVGLAVGIWNFVGESAMALAPEIGEELLKMMEKEMGLEIAGEDAKSVLAEIGRLMVDEFGLCTAADITVDGNSILVQTKDALVEIGLTKHGMASGVEKPFLNVIANTGLAALKRMKIKARCNFAINAANRGFDIKFDLL